MITVLEPFPETSPLAGLVIAGIYGAGVCGSNRILGCGVIIDVYKVIFKF